MKYLWIKNVYYFPGLGRIGIKMSYVKKWKKSEHGSKSFINCVKNNNIRFFKVVNLPWYLVNVDKK